MDDINNLQSLLDRSIKEEYDVPKLLSDALKQKFAQQNPVMQERERRLADLYAAPEEAANVFSQPRTTNIGMPGQTPLSIVNDVYLNPSAQMALTARRTASQFSPVATLNDILSAQYGGIENILGETRKLYESRTKRAESKLKTGIDLEKLRIQSAKAAQPSATDKKQAQKTSDSIKELGEILDAIRNARGKLEQGGGGLSGLFAGLRKYIPSGFPGAVGKKTTDLDAALSTVNKSIFKTAGKAFTKTEAEVIGGRVPKVGHTPQAVNSALDELERDATARLNEILTGQYSPGEDVTELLENLTSGINQGTEWEVIE